MSISPDADLPGVLEALMRAEAELVRRLLEAAPLPEGSAKDARHFELMARYDRYMPSREVTEIARFLYMLDAFGVTDGAAFRRLVLAHTARMAALAADTAHLARLRRPKPRLLEARFTDGAATHAVLNFGCHRRPALDATGMGWLLVEFANKHQVAEAMELLAALGFFDTVPSTHNAKVFVSTGRLEAIYRDHLAQLARGVGGALGGPGTKESGHGA